MASWESIKEHGPPIDRGVDHHIFHMPYQQLCPLKKFNFLIQTQPILALLQNSGSNKEGTIKGLLVVATQMSRGTKATLPEVIAEFH